MNEKQKMVTDFLGLRDLPQASQFGKGDVLVLFGELFRRGYANGIVDLAKSSGMILIGATIGRRDESNDLRPLTEEELTEAEQNLGGKIINVPLEAGFLWDSAEGMPYPEELLHDVNLKNFHTCSLDWKAIEAAKEIGVKRFQNSLSQFVEQLHGLIPEGAGVFFVHTMAGGVPRTRSIAPILNHVFKGTGKRYLDSEELWKSELGQFLRMNFDEVTANTFQHLIDLTKTVRDRVASWSREIRYMAYGYHGTEILMDGRYQWQAYNFYIQGEAKLHLEEVAIEAWKKGIRATVYNCPEIGTNSTTVFPGVELALYSFLGALQKEQDGEWTRQQFSLCEQKLLGEIHLEDMLKKVEENLLSPVIQSFQYYDQWPLHHTQELADCIISLSKEIVNAHRDSSDLIIDYLSALIYEGTGSLIFQHILETDTSVLWLGHDIIAKDLIQRYATPP